jgi:uncharacterized protein
MKRFDLRSLRFHDESEVWRTLPVEVDPFEYGGLEYRVPGDAVDADLTVARVGDNLTLTLDLQADVVGPCQRCLGDAEIAVDARGVEYVRHGESETDEQGDAYVEADQLDVRAWVRDLIAEALPNKLLCRDDCRGLCAVCGADLNDDPGHRHEEA